MGNRDARRIREICRARANMETARESANAATLQYPVGNLRKKANSPTPLNLFAKSNFPFPTEIRRARKKRICAMRTSGACKWNMVMFERQLWEREIAGK